MASGDEEFDDLFLNEGENEIQLDQKASISAAMIQLLEEKIDHLKNHVSERKNLVAHDVDGFSTSFSSMEKNKVNIDTSIVSDVKSNQVDIHKHYKPPTGFDDVFQLGGDEKINKIKRNDQAESRTNQSIKMIKESSKYNSRDINSILKYKYNFADPPFDIKFDLYIDYCLQWLKPLKFHDIFDSLMLSDVSIQFCRDLFWYSAYLFIYPQDINIEEMNQKIGLDLLNFMENLNEDKDDILNLCPFFYSYVINKIYYYEFSGSRSLYSTEFENQIYLLLVNKLFGFSFSLNSIQVSKNKYFKNFSMAIPDDNADVIKPIVQPQSFLPDLVKRDKSLPSREPTAKKSDLNIIRRSKQDHAKFNLFEQNPTISQFTNQSSKRTLEMGITTPVGNCKYGGENTYKPVKIDKKQIEQQMINYQKNKKLFKDAFRSFPTYMQILKSVDKENDEVISSGQMNLSRISLDLTYKREERKRKEKYQQEQKDTAFSEVLKNLKSQTING